MLLRRSAALKRAIAIYPDYLAAHNDLGAQLLEQAQLDEAADELQCCHQDRSPGFQSPIEFGHRSDSAKQVFVKR